MEQIEKAIDLEQIQVNSPYGLAQLTDFRMVSKPNQHTRVIFSGMVADTQKDSCIEKATARDRITINLTESGKKVRNLFRGVVANLTVKSVRDTYFLETEALSTTSLLDIRLKNRSFQNRQMSYPDLFQTILADYPKSSYTDRVTQGKKLQELLIQFQETDWRFLARAASHFGAVLIPDHTSESPAFWLGVPEGEERRIADVQYTMGKDLEGFRIGSQNYNERLPEIDFVGYRVESRQLFNPGDRVKFRGANLVIAQISAGFHQGALKSEYLLTPKDGLRQNKITNKQLAGVSLRGKVIDRRRDQVRLHLEIDRAQNKDEAYWFPVVSPYSAEGQSGWYCMPELHDDLQLYFANDREESAAVIGSLRKNGATNSKTADPAEKYFGNPHDKELLMDKRQLKFSAKENPTGKIFIKLDTEEGVTIQSDQMIKMEAGSDITWDAKTIAINARHGVYMVCNQSSLFIDRGIDFKAEKVWVEGQARGEKAENTSENPDSQSEPEKTDGDDGPVSGPAGPGEDGFGQDVAGSIPGRAAVDDEAESQAGFDIWGSIPRRAL